MTSTIRQTLAYRFRTILVLAGILSIIPCIHAFNPNTVRAGITPGPGSGAVRVRHVADTDCLELPCTFTSVSDRCYWDIPASIDLRGARGISLRLYCPDISPVSQFNVYLNSQGCWHAATFSVIPGRWQTVSISKSEMRAEGNGRGWANVSTVRIACWKGLNTATWLGLSDISVVRGNPEVGILRCGSALPRSKRSEAARYAGNIDTALGSLGLQPVIIDDTDLAGGLSTHLSCLIVPYLPNSSYTATSAIETYLQKGGKVVGFYECPASLASRIGFDPGHYTPATSVPGGFTAMEFSSAVISGIPSLVRQRSGNIVSINPIPGRSRVAGWWRNDASQRTGHNALVVSASGAWFSHVYLGKDMEAGPEMLFSVVAFFSPSVWGKAVDDAIGSVAYNLGYPNFAAADLALSSLPGASSQQALQQARNFYRAAVKLRGSSQSAAAIDFAQKCREKLEAAVLASQRGPRDEFRAVWCHRGYGISGWSWDQTVQEVNRAGFNALFVNMSTGGSAWYPSGVLERKTSADSRSADNLSDCLTACRKYGLQLHVWKLCFSLSGDSRAVRQRFSSEGRLQRSREGAELPWLCPSHPENLRLELEAAAEVMDRYNVDGYHLDFIRYPGSHACFCPRCRSAFERYLGKTIRGWPQVIDEDPRIKTKWLDFRRATITAYVRQLRDTVKKYRSRAVFSAAVFSNWSSARDTVGQDWAQWCRSGLLDAVLPMDYVGTPSLLETTIKRHRLHMGNSSTRLYPGLGLSVSNLDAVDLFRQIQVTRRLGCPGFCVFEYNESEARGPLAKLSEALANP